MRKVVFGVDNRGRRVLLGIEIQVFRLVLSRVVTPTDQKSLTSFLCGTEVERSPLHESRRSAHEHVERDAELD